MYVFIPICVSMRGIMLGLNSQNSWEVASDPSMAFTTSAPNSCIYLSSVDKWAWRKSTFWVHWDQGMVGFLKRTWGQLENLVKGRMKHDPNQS